VNGAGNQVDYGMRVYDSRIGKFLSVDPLRQKYPWYTPYQFAGNTPIWAIDIDGREPKPFNQWGTWVNCTERNSYTSEQKNDVNVVNFGDFYGDDKNYIAVRDQNDVKKWHYITYEKVIGTLGNVQNGNWELNVAGTHQYEPFTPEGFTADDADIRQTAKQVGEFGKTYEKVIWNTTIFLTTGGLGSSGVFGTSLLGRIGANVFEDVSGQLLSNGMDWKSLNLTGLGANVLPGFKSNGWTLFAKNCKLPLKLGHGQLEFSGFSNILSTKRLPSIFEGFPFAVCG